MNALDMLASAVKDRPHSFDHIRRTTGLELSDEQFTTLVKENRNRFKIAHFLKRDDEGRPIRPGRPGVRLRDGGHA